VSDAAAADAVTLPPVWPGLCARDLAGPYLIGGHCKTCGFMTLGVRPRCPGCWAADSMREIPIGRRGHLYTYTVIHQLPPGYDAPFAVGYVDLAEGVRVFAHIDNTPESLRIGAEVALTIAPVKRDDKGAPLAGPRFVAVSA
jgi:uncharacterized OB-fold protein